MAAAATGAAIMAVIAICEADLILTSAIHELCPPKTIVPSASDLLAPNLYLVGMMGCGKSSTGRILARKLGYRWLDADQVLETAAGRTIPTLFAQEGEEGFRAMETDVLRQMGQWHSCVVATGGGVVIRPANWGVMRQGVGHLAGPPPRNCC